MEAFLPLMEAQGVSEVARSHRGFLTAYQRSGDNPSAMGLVHPDTPRTGYPWWQRRNEFISRHMGQISTRGEALWDRDGDPTRRHLGLIAWAYTPDIEGVKQWVKRH